MFVNKSLVLGRSTEKFLAFRLDFGEEGCFLALVSGCYPFTLRKKNIIKLSFDKRVSIFIRHFESDY